MTQKSAVKKLKKGKLFQGTGDEVKENTPNHKLSEDPKTASKMNTSSGDASSAHDIDAPKINYPNCERYQLVSIICHIGASISLGHYKSYIFNFKRSKWYLCNDEYVKEIDLESLLEETATISLCYYYVHMSESIVNDS